MSVNRASAEGDDPRGDDAEGADEDASGPGGLAERLSGPVAGVKEAYQRATNKLAPAALVFGDDEGPPKYLGPEGEAAPVGPEEQAEGAPSSDGAATDGDARSDDEVVELDELVPDAPPLTEESEEELEVEAAELAPVVVLPDHAVPVADATPATDEVVAVADALDAAAVDAAAPDDDEAPAVVMARRVRKVVRRIDAFSVLKLSLVFYACLFVIFLIAGILLWSMAVNAGDSIENIESFIVDIGFEEFEFVGSDILRGYLIFGAAMVVIGTIVNLLLAVLFNLISDLVGGIRYTVIEPVEPDQITEID